LSPSIASNAVIILVLSASVICHDVTSAANFAASPVLVLSQNCVIASCAVIGVPQTVTLTLFVVSHAGSAVAAGTGAVHVRAASTA
jgi:hypothetical protein